MPKTIKTVPGTRVLCPEDCRYRNKLAPFCGYCMLEILGRKETEEEDGQSKAEADGKAEKERDRY